MHEGEIKVRLHALLDLSATDKLVDELPLDSHAARADVAIVNGSLSGYVIKSKYDDLSRLQNQIHYYDRVFSFSTVVADSRHAEATDRLIPNHWGVISVESDKKQLFWIRKPTENLSLNAEALTRLLWQSELLQILECHVGKSASSKSSRKILRLKIVNALSVQVISKLVAQTLKSRQRWRVD